MQAPIENVRRQAGYIKLPGAKGDFQDALLTPRSVCVSGDL